MTSATASRKNSLPAKRGEKTPFTVLYLVRVLGLILVPLLMMLIRPLMTSGDGLWFVLKFLVYLAVIAFGVCCAFFVGDEMSCGIVDTHQGHFTKTQRNVLEITGLVLAALIVYSILNLYGLRLLRPLDNMVIAVRNTLTGWTGITQRDDLRRSFLEAYLFIGLGGFGMACGASTAWNARCPSCGKYNANRSVLVDSEVLGVEHALEEGGSRTEERFNGPFGGRGTGMDVDLFRYCMNGAEQADTLMYGSDYNAIAKEAHGVRETTTKVSEVEITHRKDTHKITCKYCGKFIRYDVRNVDEKKVLNTKDVTETRDMTYRFY